MSAVLAKSSQANLQERDAPSREQILAFEAKLRKLPPLDVRIDHTFGPGFYARTMHLPAGALLTGKIHSTEHIFFVSKGKLAVITEDGRELLEAGFQKVCRPGLKRVGFALTDVVVTNVHITEENDLEKIEAQVIMPEALSAPGPNEVLA